MDIGPSCAKGQELTLESAYAEGVRDDGNELG
jgi:hypothetical protein